MWLNSKTSKFCPYLRTCTDGCNLQNGIAIVLRNREKEEVCRKDLQLGSDSGSNLSVTRLVLCGARKRTVVVLKNYKECEYIFVYEWFLCFSARLPFKWIKFSVTWRQFIYAVSVYNPLQSFLGWEMDQYRSHLWNTIVRHSYFKPPYNQNTILEGLQMFLGMRVIRTLTLEPSHLLRTVKLSLQKK